MSLEIHGMNELLKSIENMGKKVDKKTEEKALIEGGKVLIKAAKEEANRVRDDGTLHDNIKDTKVKNSKITIHTGEAYHAHLVEFGRSSGQGSYRDKNGKRRKVKWGDTAPNPVMGRAFENSQSEIMKAMSKVIKRELDL